MEQGPLKWNENEPRDCLRTAPSVLSLECNYPLVCGNFAHIVAVGRASRDAYVCAGCAHRKEAFAMAESLAVIIVLALTIELIRTLRRNR